MSTLGVWTGTVSLIFEPLVVISNITATGNLAMITGIN